MSRWDRGTSRYTDFDPEGDQIQGRPSPQLLTPRSRSYATVAICVASNPKICVSTWSVCSPNWAAASAAATWSRQCETAWPSQVHGLALRIANGHFKPRRPSWGSAKSCAWFHTGACGTSAAKEAFAIEPEERVRNNVSRTGTRIRRFSRAGVAGETRIAGQIGTSGHIGRSAAIGRHCRRRGSANRRPWQTPGRARSANGHCPARRHLAARKIRLNAKPTQKGSFG